MTSNAMKKREVLMGSPEVSRWVGIPERTLDQWAYRKTGPAYIKVGRHRRYRPSDVERWLDEQTRGGPS
jgi:predicted DNA-binding transcriptional regulator AlpA